MASHCASRCRILIALYAALHAASCTIAETGYDAWLRYQKLPESGRAAYESLPHSIVNLERTPIAESAEAELIRGVKGMLGVELRAADALQNDAAIVLCTPVSVRKAIGERDLKLQIDGLDSESFVIRSVEIDGKQSLFIIGGDDRGILYGAFALLRRMALHQPIDDLDLQ